MNIIKKIYLKEVIATHWLLNGWGNVGVTKRMYTILQHPEWLVAFAQSSRGKYTYSKALARFRNQLKTS